MHRFGKIVPVSDLGRAHLRLASLFLPFVFVIVVTRTILALCTFPKWTDTSLLYIFELIATV